MTARQNSTQLKAQRDEFTAAYDDDKNAVSVRILSDGRIAFGDGSPLSYADAHKLITNARTEQRESRKGATAEARKAKADAKRKKLEARKAGIEAALAALAA